MSLGKRRWRPFASRSSWPDQNAHDILTYEALNARVSDRDALLWQSPALALTAEAFLLTISLGPGTSPIARAVSAFLGLVVTALSMQLMGKHRMHMATDELVMIALERKLGMTSAHDRAAKVKYLRANAPGLLSRLPKGEWLLQQKSVNVWLLGLLIFGVVNVLLLVMSIFQPSFLYPIDPPAKP